MGCGVPQETGARRQQIEQQSHAGPFPGPKPESMTVLRGARRSGQKAHPSQLRWACGFLPSWSCEFDSRRPLQSIAPSQPSFTVPKLFEHGDDKNNHAGHLFFMIISTIYQKCLVRRDFMSCQSGGVKVDHACYVPNSCPIATSFGFENRPLRLSSLECGLARARCPSSVAPLAHHLGRESRECVTPVGPRRCATDQHRPRVRGNDLHGRSGLGAREKSGMAGRNVIARRRSGRMIGHKR